MKEITIKCENINDLPKCAQDIVLHIQKVLNTYPDKFDIAGYEYTREEADNNDDVCVDTIHIYFESDDVFYPWPKSKMCVGSADLEIVLWGGLVKSFMFEINED